MNRDELDRQLRTARVPDRPAEYWEAFPDRVMTRICADRPLAPRRQAWQTLTIWTATAAAGVLLGWCVLDRPQRLPQDPYPLLQTGEVVREAQALFPQRLRAIEQDDRGMHVVLSEQPDVPASRPLWIEIREGAQCRAVVTFSGQPLQVAGEPVEVLADRGGRVMLVGDRFFWSDGARSSLAPGLSIQAKTL